MRAPEDLQKEGKEMRAVGQPSCAKSSKNNSELPMYVKLNGCELLNAE
jgi:hypothetical protein